MFVACLWMMQRVVAFSSSSCKARCYLQGNVGVCMRRLAQMTRHPHRFKSLSPSLYPSLRFSLSLSLSLALSLARGLARARARSLNLFLSCRLLRTKLQGKSRRPGRCHCEGGRGGGREGEKGGGSRVICVHCCYYYHYYFIGIVVSRY